MAGDAGTPHAARLPHDVALDAEEDERLVLGELINRVLDKGVVISGQVTISVADIDLIALDLRVLITSIQTALERFAAADSAGAQSLDDADLPVLPTDPGRGR